jgi:hypothetical protein
MRGAGKSTLCISVAKALEARDPSLSVGIHELDIWSDTHPCILGEKPWEQRNKRGSSHPGEELIDEYRAAIAAYAADGSRIVLGDLPGRANRIEHDDLVAATDGVVLVSRHAREDDAHQLHPQPVEFWERKLRALGLPVIVPVHSLLPGQQAPLGRIAIDGLEREPIPEHPGVRDLATQLIAAQVPATPIAATG